MDLRYELKKRLSKEEDTYSVLGAELKSRRLALSKTLSSIADNNISVSYLCKIERNQVKPSKHYLHDICEKLDITEDKMSYILNSKDMLIDAVRIYFFNDLETKNSYLEKLEGLESHRIVLINFILYLTEGNYQEANDMLLKILKLTSSLADLDLVIFATFYGIYLYKTNNYLEAADYLKLALEYNSNIKYLKPLQDLYLFKSSLRVNSISTNRYYLVLEADFNDYGKNIDYDMINYEMCLYYLAERQYECYKKTLAKIADIYLINSLEIIFSLISYDFEKLTYLKNKKFNSLAKLVLDLNENENDFLKSVADSDIRVEYKLTLKYFYLKKVDLDEAYTFSIEDCFGYAINNNLYYYAHFYLVELANAFPRSNKYKRFFEMFNEVEKVRILANQV